MAQCGDTVMDIGFSNVNPVIHVPGTPFKRIHDENSARSWTRTSNELLHPYSHSFCPSFRRFSNQFYNEEIALAWKLAKWALASSRFKKEVQFLPAHQRSGRRVHGRGLQRSVLEEWGSRFCHRPFTIKNRYVTEDVPVALPCVP